MTQIAHNLDTGGKYSYTMIPKPMKILELHYQLSSSFNEYSILLDK